ncbi:MAG TPA: hypothetical protein VI248_29540 [Kineosporiaceae bacterium]
MTRITSECPTCGRVALTVDEFTLVVDPRQGSGWYLFECYGCATQVIKHVPASVARTLSQLRIPVRTLPAEVLERSDALHRWPPLGADDLLDLVLWLRAHDDLADLPADVR